MYNWIQSNKRTCIKFIRVFAVFAACIIFLLIGYWFAAALNEASQLGFMTSLLKVLKKPFGHYYNNYTPIVMLITLVFFEAMLFLFFVHTQTRRVSLSLLEKSDEYVKEKPLDESMFLQLLERGYSAGQIREMLKIADFIDNVSVSMLTKMFHITMSETEISSYIEIFFKPNEKGKIL